MAQDPYQPPSSEAPLPHDKMTTDHRSLWSLKRWFGKDGKEGKDDVTFPLSSEQDELQGLGVVRRFSRKVVPGLPRSGTFKRQQSELRDRLEPTKPKPEERRTVSVDRKVYVPVRDISTHEPSPLPRTSAPVLMETGECVDFEPESKEEIMSAQVSEVNGFDQASDCPPADSASFVDHQSLSNDGFDDELLEELEKRWILNLSMHFRDRSNREKFFVTFAETPNHWRRVTISLDYRNAPLGSLEEELQNTRFQRDKSARIYESIRDSLPDIQFYDTVTNLKLQTEHDRLHVHVTEDIHEVINYPSVTAINHLPCRVIREDELVFDSHLSGFVYKVTVNNQIFIKKEIPGPDTVEEFLYEINALYRLSGSDSVIQFGGVIADNDGRLLKGLLISYAEKGALIDVIFDHKGKLSWNRRERWARQIVQGLSEIHEAGFVQGDFTLSNIVIDGDDKAKIIDINRRGCPVGWEPPEVAALIESKQRISMYIGVKSDLYQLGMVLWAIAMEQDEPESQPRPLTLSNSPEEIPSYYCAIVRICLSDDPRKRYHAARLLDMFPENVDDRLQQQHERATTPNLMETQYIDPATAVERDDIDNFRALSSRSSDAAGNRRSSATHTYVNAPTDTSGEPYYYPKRGRSPPPRSLHETPLTVSNHDFREPDNETQGIDHYDEADEVYESPPNYNNNKHSNEADLCDEYPIVPDVVFEQSTINSAYKHENAADVVHELTLSRDEYEHNKIPDGYHKEREEAKEVVEQIPNHEGHGDMPKEDCESAPVHNHPEHNEEPIVHREDYNEPVVHPNIMTDFHEPRLIDISPPNYHHTHIQSVQPNSTLENTIDNTFIVPEKSLYTETAPELIPEELAGIGQHSTLELSTFPQGVLDDDLTTEMH